MKPMLAGKYVREEIENRLQEGRLVVQPKLDGIRAIKKKDGLYSRSMKFIRNKYIQETICLMGDVLDGFDGELCVGDPWAHNVYTKTSSGVMSRDGKPDFVYWVFDLWNTDITYRMRAHKLNAIFKTNPQIAKYVKLVDAKFVYSMRDITQNQKFYLDVGYEGIILRDPISTYKFGRATPKQGQLIKMKTFVDAEATVMGFQELVHNANKAQINELGHTIHSQHKENLVPMNMLGALLCKFKMPSGEQVEQVDVSIGTGFDHNQRKKIWANKADYLGKLVKFKYTPIGVKDKPRHPVFLGWRDSDDL